MGEEIIDYDMLLIPCPFCSENAGGFDKDIFNWFKITCNACGGSGPPATDEKTAIEGWNCRNYHP